jgi:hypothetical protein
VGHGADIDEIRAAAASAGQAKPHRPACEQIFDDPTASATVGIWRVADDGWSVILKALRHQTGAMLEAAAGGKTTLNGAPIEECIAQWAPVVPELIAFARRV